MQFDLVSVHFINPSSINHLTFMGILIASHCIDFSPFLQFSEIMQYFKPVFHCITRFSWGVIDINLKNEKLGWISGENFLMVRSARMHCCLSMGSVAVPLACALKPSWRTIRLQVVQNNAEVGGEGQAAKPCSSPPMVTLRRVCSTPSSHRPPAHCRRSGVSWLQGRDPMWCSLWR